MYCVIVCMCSCFPQGQPGIDGEDGPDGNDGPKVSYRKLLIKLVVLSFYDIMISTLLSSFTVVPRSAPCMYVYTEMYSAV